MGKFIPVSHEEAVDLYLEGVLDGAEDDLEAYRDVQIWAESLFGEPTACLWVGDRQITRWCEDHGCYVEVST